MAALAMTGVADAGWTGGGRAFDFFDAKGAVGSLMTELGVAWSLSESLDRPFHPGRSADVVVAGQVVGRLGEIHPSVAASLDLTGRVRHAGRRSWLVGRFFLGSGPEPPAGRRRTPSHPEPAISGDRRGLSGCAGPVKSYQWFVLRSR